MYLNRKIVCSASGALVAIAAASNAGIHHNTPQGWDSPSMSLPSGGGVTDGAAGEAGAAPAMVLDGMTGYGVNSAGAELPLPVVEDGVTLPLSGAEVDGFGSPRDLTVSRTVPAPGGPAALALAGLACGLRRRR